MTSVRLPRKGILIRLCIYLPLLGFFGWRAYEKWRSENAPPVQQQPDSLEQYRRTVTLPDGTQQDYYELTREQAEQMYGPLPAEGAPTPGTVKAGDAPKKAE